MYMKKIADNFDPLAQREREHDRAEQSLSAVQILALNSQLRDSQQTVNSLRSEITQLYSRLHTSESNCQRLELKLKFSEVDARMQRLPRRTVIRGIVPSVMKRSAILMVLPGSS